MFIPPIAQSRKPSREPKNKKSILAATFLRLAIVPSRRITDHGAKAQVICHETSDSCFAWGERELLIAKKLQKYLDFCFDNGGSAVAERIPQKIGSRQQQRSRYREIGGIGQPITSASIPSAFLNDSYSWHACRSRLKSGTLFTCDQRFVLQKRKARNANQSRIAR